MFKIDNLLQFIGLLKNIIAKHDEEQKLIEWAKEMKKNYESKKYLQYAKNTPRTSQMSRIKSSMSSPNLNSPKLRISSKKDFLSPKR